MLTIHHLSKSYGLTPILNDISFSLNPGERWGLVGPNGCGKTTLLRIITAQETADAGVVQFTPADLRVGYLAQGLNFEEGDSLLSYLARMQGDLTALSNELEILSIQLATGPVAASLTTRYDVVLTHMQLASENAGRAPAVLSALGLDDLPHNHPVATLSGGQKTRLGLAGVLLSGPHLLLLDEPTNHLDFEMLDWLEDWLKRFNGGVLVVSHDRAFLDGVSTGIVEIDPLTHQARAYPGNYSSYMEQKAAEHARQWQEYDDQQVEIARLHSAAAHLRGIATFRKGGKADSGDKFAKGFFANRALGTVGRAKHIEARLDKLMREDRVEKPGRTWQMKMEFNGVPSGSRAVVTLSDVSVGYGEHVLLRGLNLSLRYGDRVALIGPNGSGKTTLLRTIAGRILPLAGTLQSGPSVHMGYMAQEQENLDPAMDVFDTIRSQHVFTEVEARSFLSKFLFKGDEVFARVGNLSYGERARLTLACLVAQGCNLLLLDEPVNHLDIPSRSQFEQTLANYEGTVLAVAHDRYFIAAFAHEIWRVEDSSVLRHAWLEDETPVSLDWMGETE